MYEIYASDSDITIIPGRNLLFHIFGCKGIVDQTVRDAISMGEYWGQSG